MAACQNGVSTGYEALASTKMSAVRGKAKADYHNIASDEEMTESYSAADKHFALAGAASSTNERSDGICSRPLAGSSSGASRTRSRSSRSTSKGESSAGEVQTAKHTFDDKRLESGGKTLRSESAGQRLINFCDPCMQRGVTGLSAPHNTIWVQTSPVNKNSEP